MATILVLLLSLSHTLHSTLATSDIASVNLFGSNNNCLLNRIDLVPCDFLMPNSTRAPAANEYGVYNTRFRRIAGEPRCQIVSRGHYVQPIQVIGTTDQVLTIYSPGFTSSPPRNYRDNLFVDYNIECGNGRIAYVEILNMSLEASNCLGRCRDYVKGSGLFGAPETCGRDADVDLNPSLQSSFHIIFRSSTNGRFPGFAANVICFEPKVMEMTTCDSSDTSRKRRSLDSMFEQMKSRAEDALTPRGRRQVPLRNTSNDVRFERIPLRFGKGIYYSLGKIYFANNSGIRKFKKFDNVDVLYVIQSSSTTHVYWNSAYVQRGLRYFFKPGVLYIIGRRAYYHIYGPEDFELTQQERRVLVDLTRPHLKIAQEMWRRMPETREGGPFSFTESLGRRQRRQGNRFSIPTFENGVVRLAISNENSCNPVIRAAAMSIIEDTEEIDPGRLRVMRRLLM